MAVETNRIEYKQCLTEDLEKEAVAFLNYREGGVLYIGVNKAGVPVGVKDLDGDMLKIKDRLKNNIQPSCMGLRAYGRECFRFTENFLRMTIPACEPVTPQVTPQVSDLLKVMDGEMTRQEVQDKLELIDREYFRTGYLRPALAAGVIEMTVPDKPNSRFQKYRLTPKGLQLKNQNGITK